MAELKPGQVIRLPKGSDLTYDALSAISTNPVHTRKDRLGVVEYVFGGEGFVCFTDKQGRHPVCHTGDAELVSADNHQLHVERFKRGGYPIAGWNWPLWGYRYTCNCGEGMGEDDGAEARAAHTDHLERLANG